MTEEYHRSMVFSIHRFIMRLHKFRLCPGFTAGRPLTSQTAFGGQLPYKGSLVRPVARFHHSLFEYSGGLLRATNHEPRATIFSRAEGYSRRCRQFESVAAQRHLNPRRPANCGLRGHQPLTLFFLSSRGRFRRPGRRTRCFGPGR